MIVQSLPVAALAGLLVLGCQSQDSDAFKQDIAHRGDEIIFSPDSPKLQHIREEKVELTLRPLMDPIPGKVTYDETRTARVTSPIAGRVVGSIVPLGEQVRSGTPLVELDSPELGQARSDHANAVSDLNLANQTFHRIEELYGDGIAPRKDREQAEDNLSRARSEAERTRLKLANLRVHAQKMDNRFVLQSPISGTVTEREINPGMEVRPDVATPLFVISDLDQLWVQADVFEKDIGLIQAGKSVRVRVPAYPGESFTATISYISQIVDETTRTVKVRCTLPNADGRLLPSMYAAVEVLSDPDDLVIAIPLSALVTGKTSDWVYVNMGNHHYQKRPVKVGPRLKDRVVIHEGLNPGEHVVIEGALLLRAEQGSALQKRQDKR
ncbi:membrane fusion protein, cobalt-zinc-cadmium efflux system [Nitrosospira multiformis]|uniref:Membrane fusion protein, cobalt-zinc-cadmium efflux system n=1 Tax=Nitrosospira multiformis TaxID=1231 RepID=A0A1I0FS41_9PROT|nr:efflux RND transporter periplasmic adaptor subunit [Nitrosospira multiformis]SET61318.1 membrane fusion protein, cobalt-zinc-cadmium efflux system [Nitrosospira multiformis]